MARSPWPRRLAHGFVAGVLLSCMRAPLGLDWTQLPAVQGTTAALFRAAALLGVALALDPARRAPRAGLGAGWLAAACAGFALHGLVLDWTPSGRAGYALLLLVGTALLFALAGPRAAPPDEAGEEAAERLTRVERLGLVLAGLGAAFALEDLAHETRLFTMATRADDALVGTVFLALLALAAAAFGPLLAKLGSERVRSAAGVALAGASALAGLWFLAQLTPGGLHGYLRRLDHSLGWLRALDEHLGGRLGLAAMPTLDGASIGTFWATVLLSAAALVVPCFALGGTLGATRHSGRIAHALVGAALGLVLLPGCIHARAVPLDLEATYTSAFAWELFAAGTTTAAVGVALAAIGVARKRAAGLALALGIALVPWIRPHQLLWSFSPWSASLVTPELVLPTGDGLLTVEPDRDGTSVLTLDRRRLTPVHDEEAADEQRLRRAFALLPPERRAGSVRALFVGQLTPARMRVLRALGVRELERTAPWYAAMPAVEARLFRNEEPPAGRIVAPGEARAKLADGGYDWIVAPPTRGPVVTWKTEARELWGSVDAPRGALALAGDAVGVAWIAGDSLAARGSDLGPLVLEVDRLETLCLGLVRAPDARGGPEVGPLFECRDVNAPSPLRFLGTLPQQRQFHLERAWSAALRCAAAPELAHGLALHFAAQGMSSPYEPRAAQIELDEDALRAFLAAWPAPGALDAFSREVWESVAWLVTEKREPELALVYVERVGERFAPWPELDRAVARAHGELLEWDEAERLLARARAARPLDVEVLLESAHCAEQRADWRAAAEFLEHALALQPSRSDIERSLGLALLRAGDERGRKILEHFLGAYPDDEQILRALGRLPANDGSGDENGKQ